MSHFGHQGKFSRAWRSHSSRLGGWCSCCSFLFVCLFVCLFIGSSGRLSWYSPVAPVSSGSDSSTGSTAVASVYRLETLSACLRENSCASARDCFPAAHPRRHSIGAPSAISTPRAPSSHPRSHRPASSSFIISTAARASEWHIFDQYCFFELIASSPIPRTSPTILRGAKPRRLWSVRSLDGSCGIHA